MTDLEGKTALVTGSTSGIGRATAVALAARGAHVPIVGRDERRATDVVAEIEGGGGSATFRLTTLGDLESARALVAWATEAGEGRVDTLINNAGIAMAASFGQPGMAMYGASRAALELLTKAWAAEYGPRGVRVNAVAPGPTRTPLMDGIPDEMVNQLAALAPAGRVAEPEELAAAIVFLASDDASFVQGVTLAVDVGRVAT